MAIPNQIKKILKDITDKLITSINSKLKTDFNVTSIEYSNAYKIGETYNLSLIFKDSALYVNLLIDLSEDNPFVEGEVLEGSKSLLDFEIITEPKIKISF